MNKTQKVLISLGIALLAIVMLSAFNQSPKSDAPSVASPTVQKVGALASPDIPYNWFSFGEVRRWAYRKGTLSSSPFICSIQSPNATTTLVSGGMYISSVNAATSSTIIVAKATTATATTTLINTTTLVASAADQAINFASTTVNAGEFTNRIFGPNQYLNVTMASSSSVFSPTGICQATFEQL